MTSDAKTDISREAVDALANEKRWIIEERDRTFALMLERAVKAEAERDAAVKFLAEAVDDLKIKESLHTNERGRDCLAFLAAHLGAKP